ncbi:MAG: MAPEG family protein [Alphaproteobacteria bacterium]|nr:MAPEG family protein [Alphaproteobacteria bacterium]
MLITPIYAALLGLVYVFLTLRTIRQRRRFKISLGDSGIPQLQRAIRVHANFAEYVPFTLLLIYFAEENAAPKLLILVLGLLLFCGRLIHAWGVSRNPEIFQFRVLGMVATLTTVIIAALYILYTCLV